MDAARSERGGERERGWGNCRGERRGQQQQQEQLQSIALRLRVEQRGHFTCSSSIRTFLLRSICWSVRVSERWEMCELLAPFLTHSTAAATALSSLHSLTHTLNSFSSSKSITEGEDEEKSNADECTAHTCSLCCCSPLLFCCVCQSSSLLSLSPALALFLLLPPLLQLLSFSHPLSPFLSSPFLSSLHEHFSSIVWTDGAAFDGQIGGQSVRQACEERKALHPSLSLQRLFKHGNALTLQGCLQQLLKLTNLNSMFNRSSDC